MGYSDSAGPNQAVSNEAVMNWQLPPYFVEDENFAPLSQTIDWGVAMLGLPDLWKETQGEGVKIALLDTGSGKQHPDLAEAIILEQDFTGSRYGPADINGHGTHCAGIMGARNNDIGVVGVAPKVQICVGKVLGDNGSGSDQGIAGGIAWAISQGCDIISMSLGSPQSAPTIKAAIDQAVARGIFVICAAGNSGPNPNTVDYPGRYDDVVAVAAINQQKQVSKFSSRGPEVDIAAPGEKILSTWLNGGTATLSGTSMATPFVAGCVALCLAAHRKLGNPPKNVQELLTLLKSTAIDIDQLGPDPNAGAGLVDPSKLVGPVDTGGTEVLVFDKGVTKVTVERVK
jgi:subtilisin